MRTSQTHVRTNIAANCPLSAGFDALGTIIANIGLESRANLVTSGELSHVYHLVKPEADEGDDVEKRGGKIMSEVFLTRLLSTKVCHTHWVAQLCEYTLRECMYMQGHGA